MSPTTREISSGLVGNLVDHKGKININIYITKLTKIIKIIDCDHFLNKKLIKSFLVVFELKKQFLCFVFMIKWDYSLVFLN